jgi:cytochrome c5
MTTISIPNMLPFRLKSIFLPLYLLALLLTILGANAQTTESSQTASKKTASAQTTVQNSPDPGEQKFQANCSRCHNAPQQLSPRIVGTVTRHMRVRASLSEQDERDILRFLAP